MHKRHLRWLLLLPLLFAVGWLVWWLQPADPTQQQAEALLQQYLGAESCRYTLSAQVQVGTALRDYFTLEGEQAAGAAHVWGTVLGTPVELVFLPGTLYLKSGEDGTWQQHAVADISAAADLFAELQPAEAFACRSITAYTCTGLAETEQGKVLRMVLHAEPDGWVGEYFSGAVLTLTADRKAKDLYSVTLTATGKQNAASTLHLTATFFDRGADIRIAAPV